MNRRAILSTTALAAAPVLALAACAKGTVTQSSVQQAISNADRLMGFVAPILPMLSAFDPAVASYVTKGQQYLQLANDASNTIQAAMTTAAAQPVIGKVSTYLGSALDVADQATALVTDPKQKATVSAMIGEARTVLGLLTTFATGVQVAILPTASAVPTVPHLLLRNAR